jgi:hypothetical protein
LLQQKVLEPTGGESLQAIPEGCWISTLMDTAADSECLNDLLDYTDHRGKHLVDSAEEERPGFFSEHRCMLWRQTELPRRRLIFDISCARPAAQPFARITLLDGRTPGKFRTGARTVAGQVFQQSQTIADSCGGRSRHCWYR